MKAASCGEGRWGFGSEDAQWESCAGRGVTLCARRDAPCCVVQMRVTHVRFARRKGTVLTSFSSTNAPFTGLCVVGGVCCSRCSAAKDRKERGNAALVALGHYTNNCVSIARDGQICSFTAAILSADPRGLGCIRAAWPAVHRSTCFASGASRAVSPHRYERHSGSDEKAPVTCTAKPRVVHPT